MAVSEPSPTPDTPRPDPYAAWRIANYRRYAVSWFAMTIARQIETVAMGIYRLCPDQQTCWPWDGWGWCRPCR